MYCCKTAIPYCVKNNLDKTFKLNYNKRAVFRTANIVFFEWKRGEVA